MTCTNSIHRLLNSPNLQLKSDIIKINLEAAIGKAFFFTLDAQLYQMHNNMYMQYMQRGMFGYTDSNYSFFLQNKNNTHDPTTQPDDTRST